MKANKKDEASVQQLKEERDKRYAEEEKLISKCEKEANKYISSWADIKCVFGELYFRIEELEEEINKLTGKIELLSKEEVDKLLDELIRRNK